MTDEPLLARAGAGEDATLRALVASVESISMRLADPERSAPELLREQLRAMQAIEQRAVEELAGSSSIEGRGEQLGLSLRAVVLAMTQRQQQHGRLSKLGNEELSTCALAVTACGDRLLKALLAAPWAAGAGVLVNDETSRAIALLVQTLVRLVAVGCEPSLWAPLQNTAWAKLNALREAGALSLALRQEIGAEVVKRLGDRQRSIRELAVSTGGHVNASAAGIERHAKVLRFFATKGTGLVPSEPIELAETLCGIASETLFVSWHQPKADGTPPSCISMAENALMELLDSLGAELLANKHGVAVLSALASWFAAAGSKEIPALGILLCLLRLLPMTVHWASVQQVAAAQPLMQMARSAVKLLCGLVGGRNTSAFGAVFQVACDSLAQWVTIAPVSVQPQLQLLMLEMLLTPTNDGDHPEMVVVAVTVWGTALRNTNDATMLHAHAQTLINLAVGAGPLLPSLRATTRGLLAAICDRLSTSANKATESEAGDGLVDHSATTFQTLFQSLAETVRNAGLGPGVQLVLPAVLQPPSTVALQHLQEIAAKPLSATKQQQAERLISLGNALSTAAISVSADAAPFSGAQGQTDLAVLLNTLKLLVQSSKVTAITPNALDGTATLLHLATRLEHASRTSGGRHCQSDHGSLEQATAARRLRGGCCDVLCATMGPPTSAATLPLLTRLLVLEALVESVATLSSASAANSSPALPLLKQCFVSANASAAAATISSTAPRHVVNARIWRYEAFICSVCIGQVKLFSSLFAKCLVSACR